MQALLAQKRSFILQNIRGFFFQKGFLEVDTPILVRLPGMEPYLDPFQTEFVSARDEKQQMYLITSPEYSMKRLLAEGYERIFQITKCFRNKESGGDLHNPEFTMLEWYRVYADYNDIMRDTIEFLQFLVKALFGGAKFFYQGRAIDVSKTEIISMSVLFEQYTHISRGDFEDEQRFRSYFEPRYGIGHSFDDLFFLVFLNQIEKHLGFSHPTIVKDYPASMAALAKISGKYAERFELYIAGIELANAFSELNDVLEQRRRLEEERTQRQHFGKIDYPVDEKFLAAVAKMPESAGIAFGVDRLIMLLLDAKSIRDVIFFPFEEL